jgi:hypothetical protein
MERLKDFDLHWYTKEDLIDLLEDHPYLFEMSAEDLQALIYSKYSDAQYHTERANRLENDASAIEKYYKVKYENNDWKEIK